MYFYRVPQNKPLHHKMLLLLENDFKCLQRDRLPQRWKGTKETLALDLSFFHTRKVFLFLQKILRVYFKTK